MRLLTEQEDVKELKRQMRIQTHQVDQMKEELALQEAMVSKSNVDRLNAERDSESLRVR